MRARHTVFLTSAAVWAALVLAAGSCSSDKSNNNGSGSADDLHQQLSDAYQNNLAGFGQALTRLIETANGQPQQGVALTPTANGVQGSVGVDVDGDGTLETTVNGTLTFLNQQAGFLGGANLAITSITGGAPQTASGTAVVQPLGPTTVSLNEGTFTTHTETRGNNLTVSNADLTIDGSGGGLVVTGTLDFTFNGLAGSMFFDPDGHGSFIIEVSGDSFSTFTVP